MRVAFFIVFFFICKFTFAIDRYVSPNGNDITNNGLSPSTAWQTIAKVNSSFASFAVGDRILFERGATFYGSLICTKSGVSGSPITIGAYTGALGNARPVITGFTTVSNGGWNNVGTNLWETATAISDGSIVNMVTINNVAIPMGRWPNSGYMSIDTVGTSFIYDAALPASPDWDGGEIVLRKRPWVLGRDLITNHTGTRITYTNNSPYNPLPGYGYIITNHILTLDQQNEWFWNNSTKKLTIYSTTSPTGVKVSSRNILLNISTFDFITVDNIDFQGGNVAAINWGGPSSAANNIIIQNCNIDFSGRDGIYATNNNNCLINNNTINHSWNNGIIMENESGKSLNAVITNNNIKNSGTSNVMQYVSLSASYGSAHFGIIVYGDSSRIQYNVIDSTGYVPIAIYYNKSKALNNLITNFNFAKDDGAGVYIFDLDQSGGTIEFGRQINGNIIINGIGAGLGKPCNCPQSMGIYTDDNSDSVQIIGNSISSTQTAGIYIHNSTIINVRDNTVFNSPTSELTVHDDIAAGRPIRRLAIRNNIYFGYTAPQFLRLFRTRLTASDVAASYSSMDSNIYARPIQITGNIINTITNGNVPPPAVQNLNYTLPSWKAAFPQFDVHSVMSALTTTTVNDIRFEYNATLSPKTVMLGAVYSDARMNSYNGAITLQPYTSAVLVRTGPLGGNVPPVANAGPDQTITLPTNSVTLTGSGTDSDGTISSYSWLKIFGPAPGTVSSPNSATTNVINLVQGSYQFQLTVTDNQGAIDRDTVQVVVVANQSPSANAGLDKVITLPTNSTTANGSGSDPDGTIVSYAWVQLAGPNTATLGTPNAATTTVSGLIAGTYNLQLTVTDNGGLQGTDIMQITVNPAPNVVPNANAGVDQTITLPTSTATLNGNGSTDPDGTISAYAWTKISGPSGGNITSPSNSITGVTALQQGTYTYQLIVTDNGGLTDSDIMQIIVNPAANVGPTANAGVDQTITLPTSTVSVSGSGSSDPDGTITGYAWTKISGPSGGNISTPSNVSTNITSLQQGTYVFRLIVTDNGGLTGSDFIQIIVNAANIAPTANAGADQSITLPTNSTTLNGSGTDPDGTIASYAWTKISGPAGGNITSPTSASTGITSLQQGTYVYSLQVTDNLGLTGNDFVQIVVSPANIAPTANAGSDQVITLPTSTTTLVGSGSDPDGTISSYGWLKISGPSGGTVSNPTSASTGITGLQQGTYIYQLTVTDDDGLTGTDFVQVVVNAANVAPTANAGIDQAITLPTSSATLSGSGTDPDGSIVGYSWTKISGPAGGTIASPTSASTSVTALQQGTYVFRLVVTDNQGLTGTDFMQIVVSPAPIAPTANAGVDQSITLPVNTATLSGSGTDPDGTITAYLWTKISGPAGGTITNATSASTGVTALQQGTYVFSLTVTDNDGLTGTDFMQIVVNPAIPPPNDPPVVDAGANQTVTLPTSATTLVGTASDPDGTISAVLWTKISGPTGGAISSPTSLTTGITGLVAGTYTYQLRATDNSGDTATDAMQVVVFPANIAPTANAGADQSITLPTNSTTLVGSGTDPDGSIAAYLWTKIGGPSGGAITSATSATTGITGLIAGVYIYQLRVTDNVGDTATDAVQITVNAANVAPTANAGPDQNITLPTSTTTLLGSGTDPDGTIAGYFWTKISGPAGGTINSPSNATTNITSLQQGVYIYQLRVTDNSGDTATDAMQITVSPANIAPTANAGTDQVITLPTSTTTLIGSGSDPDGTISAYLWTKLAGPAGGTIATPTASTTNISALQAGVYVFQLRVTDNVGDTATDAVQVTVNAANIAPTANAGANQTITLPINSTTLVGSGTDPDGTISAYLWTKISGTGGTIVSPTAATTDITGLSQGVYIYQLRVTDNSGDTATDAIQITVNAAPLLPVADAGPDQVITSPTNSTFLVGSGTDADGTIVAYSWVQISGPAPSIINTPNASTTQITDTIIGTYVYLLTVTDNDGDTASDAVQVTYNAAPPNINPIANAGGDKVITLPTNSVTLIGSGTDEDGTVVAYKWVGTNGVIISPNSATTVITNLTQGIHTFTFTVTDDRGGTGTDIMQVTVHENIVISSFPLKGYKVIAN